MLHVLFDIDETMLSVPKGLNAASSAVMFKKVFNVDAHEEMINNIGKTEKGIIKEVLEHTGAIKKGTDNSKEFEVPTEAYDVWGDALVEMLNGSPPRILPGIVQLIEKLSHNPNMQLQLLTGNSIPRTKAKINSVNLEKYFTDPKTKEPRGVFGSMAAKRHELFEIIKQKSAPDDRFVVIDDSILGAKLAQMYDIPIILVATGPASEEELRSFSPYVFPDFDENRWEEVAALIATL